MEKNGGEKLFTVGLTQLEYQLCSSIERSKGPKKYKQSYLQIQVAFSLNKVTCLDFLYFSTCLVRLSCLVFSKAKFKGIHKILS